MYKQNFPAGPPIYGDISLQMPDDGTSGAAAGAGSPLVGAPAAAPADDVPPRITTDVSGRKPALVPKHG